MTAPVYDHGGIRIYHGDCRELLPELLAEETPDVILADPQYGIGTKTDYLSRGRAREAQAVDFDPVVGDDEPFDPSHLLELHAQIRRRKGIDLILWGANHYADRLPPRSSWLVWDKLDGMASSSNSDLELAWTTLGGPARIFRHAWMGMIRASEHGIRRVHPTQKPVALMRWCLELALSKELTGPGLVVDPYMGSGPVLRAAKDLGHRAIGIELVESYIERTIERLAQEVLELETWPPGATLSPPAPEHYQVDFGEKPRRTRRKKARKKA